MFRTKDAELFPRSFIKLLKYFPHSLLFLILYQVRDLHPHVLTDMGLTNTLFPKYSLSPRCLLFHQPGNILWYFDIQSFFPCTFRIFRNYNFFTFDDNFNSFIKNIIIFTISINFLSVFFNNSKPFLNII